MIFPFSYRNTIKKNYNPTEIEIMLEKDRIESELYDYTLVICLICENESSLLFQVNLNDYQSYDNNAMD